MDQLYYVFNLLRWGYNISYIIWSMLNQTFDKSSWSIEFFFCGIAESGLLALCVLSIISLHIILTSSYVFLFFFWVYGFWNSVFSCLVLILFFFVFFTCCVLRSYCHQQTQNKISVYVKVCDLFFLVRYQESMFLWFFKNWLVTCNASSSR